ncbi:VOC family protein [Lichenicoccus sp.]|uniref:VOC family protein n=1 Tax=Lichenicoccus sp. TaxID=2781899 RepID=UPI003D127BC3
MADIGVTGLNHVTLAVGDLDRAVPFYRDVLGLQLRAIWSTGAYFEAGSLWLCLSLDEHARSEPHPDYTHTAFSVDAKDFGPLSTRIKENAPSWRENRSEGPSLYFLDPDGHKLEIHVGSLADRLAHWHATQSDRAHERETEKHIENS